MLVELGRRFLFICLETGQYKLSGSVEINKDCIRMHGGVVEDRINNKLAIIVKYFD